MSNVITLLFLLSWLFSSSDQRSIDDLACTSQTAVLCLKDELESIMTIIRDIIDQSTEIITNVSGYFPR